MRDADAGIAFGFELLNPTRAFASRVLIFVGQFLKLSSTGGETMSDKQDGKSFWTTIPGMLTGCAALLTAIGGFVAALYAAGILWIIFPVATPVPPTVIAIRPADTVVPQTATFTRPPDTAVPTTVPPIRPPNTPVPPTTASPTPVPQGRYIVNLLSGKCVDAIGKPGIANETRLQLWDCEYSEPYTTDQRWEFTSMGYIRNTLSGKCIDAWGKPGVSNETPLQLWDCEYSEPNTTDQRWEITSAGYIRNLLSGKCIDAKSKPGVKNETPLQLWDCEYSEPSTTDQRWTLK